MKIILPRWFSYNDNICVLVRLHYLWALHELFCVLGSEQSHILKRNSAQSCSSKSQTLTQCPVTKHGGRHSLSFVYSVFLCHTRGISLKENDLQTGLILL